MCKYIIWLESPFYAKTNTVCNVQDKVRFILT